MATALSVSRYHDSGRSRSPVTLTEGLCRSRVGSPFLAKNLPHSRGVILTPHETSMLSNTSISLTCDEAGKGWRGQVLAPRRWRIYSLARIRWRQQWECRPILKYGNWVLFCNVNHSTLVWSTPIRHTTASSTAVRATSVWSTPIRYTTTWSALTFEL